MNLNNHYDKYYNTVKITDFSKDETTIYEPVRNVLNFEIQHSRKLLGIEVKKPTFTSHARGGFFLTHLRKKSLVSKKGTHYKHKHGLKKGKEFKKPIFSAHRRIESNSRKLLSLRTKHNYENVINKNINHKPIIILT